MIDFVHLHAHTQNSKFDGFSTIKDFDRDEEKVQGIVSRAKSLGMKGIGISDHGTVSGIVEHLKECRAQEVKPILGMETYQCRKYTAKKEEQKDGRKGNRHLLIIAKNGEGYKNLCALSHKACLDGYYYDPRIDFELLDKHKSGLIVCSACLSSIINWNLSIDRYNEAKKAATMFKDIFKNDFYLEVMYHGIDLEAKIIPDILKIGKELDIKILASNDSHYTLKSDAKYQDVLLCMSTKKMKKDPSRLKFPYQEFYLKSKEEMYQVFGHIPYVLSNTIEVLEKCDYNDIVLVEEGGSVKIPKIEIPENFKTPFDYLTYLANEGLKKNNFHEKPEYIARLQRELDDIKLVWDTKRYDFTTYFLIVKDIIDFARKKNINSGIRGSGYGSLLLRCLGISEGDPIKSQLFWERFLGFSDRIFISDNDLGL